MRLEKMRIMQNEEMRVEIGTRISCISHKESGKDGESGEEWTEILEQSICLRRGL